MVNCQLFSSPLGSISHRRYHLSHVDPMKIALHLLALCSLIVTTEIFNKILMIFKIAQLKCGLESNCGNSS